MTNSPTADSAGGAEPFPAGPLRRVGSADAAAPATSGSTADGPQRSSGGSDRAPGGGTVGSVDVITRPDGDPARNPADNSVGNPEHDPAGNPAADLADELDLDEDDPDGPGSDWAWVDEWRRSEEPPAWTPGVTIATFAALVVATAVFVLSVGLADLPWLAIAANIVVAAGLAPALWLCRSLPVLRFLAGGAAVGVVIGWIAALIS